MNDNNQVVNDAVAPSQDLDFEILELTEATAMEEMGASSTVASSSTCKPD